MLVLLVNPILFTCTDAAGKIVFFTHNPLQVCTPVLFCQIMTNVALHYAEINDHLLKCLISQSVFESLNLSVIAKIHSSQWVSVRISESFCQGFIPLSLSGPVCESVNHLVRDSFHSLSVGQCVNQWIFWSQLRFTPLLFSSFSKMHLIY